MAIQLFKDGGHIYVEPEWLQSHLDMGYTLTNAAIPKDVIYHQKLKVIEQIESQPEAEKAILEEMGIRPPVEIVFPNPEIKARPVRHA